jgi:hypothetical protein
MESTLREVVPISHVLDHYGIRLRRVGTHALRGPCPLPTHTSRRSADSFNVETNLNVWACHSQSCVAARQGKTGGNALHLIALLEGCSVRDAARRLANWAGRSVQPNPPTRSIWPNAEYPKRRLDTSALVSIEVWGA